MVNSGLKGLTLHVTDVKQLPWFFYFVYKTIIIIMPYVSVVAGYMNWFKYGLLLAFHFKYVFR